MRQQAAAERWAAQQQQPSGPGQGEQPGFTKTPGLNIEKDLELRRDGPEDDMEL